MDTRLKVSLMVAAMFAGSGAFHYFGWGLLGVNRDRPERGNAGWSLESSSLAQQRRSAIVDCHEAANMFFDVKWAAACMAQVGQAGQSSRGDADGRADGHAECDLPEDQAAVVNAWLDEAEARCRAELRAGLR
ncbi:MAG TPA: hypothetical protein VLI46_08835 [Ramlibacter sp.]|nr:hypothetical protein [Ramlibacter sp.]